MNGLFVSRCICDTLSHISSNLAAVLQKDDENALDINQIISGSRVVNKGKIFLLFQTLLSFTINVF